MLFFNKLHKDNQDGTYEHEREVLQAVTQGIILGLLYLYPRANHFCLMGDDPQLTAMRDPEDRDVRDAHG